MIAAFAKAGEEFAMPEYVDAKKNRQNGCRFISCPI
jgi:hypothetical protein